MLNVFYNPDYFKRIQKKIILTRKIKYSIFLDLLISLFYRFNLPYPKNLIFSGPQMRMNHLIRTFKNEKLVSFNKLRYDHTYIVQFDSFGEEVLKKIISNKNPLTKVLVGPLFDIDMDKRLNEYIKKYNFIKKIVASNASLNYQESLFGDEFLNDTFVIPAGIKAENDLNTQKFIKKEIDCLVYFKKRSDSELHMLEEILEKNKLTYKVLKYGHYKNSTLEKLAKNCSFGIILDKTESQGFAIQNLMSLNLPLLVWDYNINIYENIMLEGTTVPFWDSNCGIKFKNKAELISVLPKFLENIHNFSPANFIKENLTYEIFRQNLNKCLNDTSNWPT